MSRYSGPTVPAGPFVAWLWDRCLKLGREEMRARLHVGGEALAGLLDQADDDPMYVAFIDALLTRYDGPESLATIYPDAPTAGRRKDYGTSYVCDERLLVLAHSMHMDGMSVRAVAREIFEDCYSASPKALAMSLLSAWRARGWEIRSKSEATALANVQRAFRPQCSHVFPRGSKAGQRCERRCVGDDVTCWKHEPARIAAAVERLRGVA